MAESNQRTARAQKALKAQKAQSGAAKAKARQEEEADCLISCSRCAFCLCICAIGYCRANVGTDADAHCNAHPCGNACVHTKSAALRRTNSCADYGIL